MMGPRNQRDFVFFPKDTGQTQLGTGSLTPFDPRVRALPTTSAHVMAATDTHKYYHLDLCINHQVLGTPQKFYSHR